MEVMVLFQVRLKSLWRDARRTCSPLLINVRRSSGFCDRSNFSLVSWTLAVSGRSEGWQWKTYLPHFLALS